MLLSTFELLLKPQFPKDAPTSTSSNVEKLSRTVIQGYFLTIANVNSFDVTASLVFTVRFPSDPNDKATKVSSFKDIIDALDITGKNIFDSQLVPEMGSENNKARLTFTIPSNTTSLLVVQPDFIDHPQLLTDANFEVRGYVEIFLSALSGSERATLLVTPQQRGTFFKNLDATALADIGLDQIAYDLPVSNGGVFKLSNS